MTSSIQRDKRGIVIIGVIRLSADLLDDDAFRASTPTRDPGMDVILPIGAHGKSSLSIIKSLTADISR
jgi:hypothetical protein